MPVVKIKGEKNMQIVNLEKINLMICNIMLIKNIMKLIIFAIINLLNIHLIDGGKVNLNSGIVLDIDAILFQIRKKNIKNGIGITK